MSGRLRLFLLISLAAMAGGFLYARVFPNRTLRLTFLSVGQGDCTVWQDGETVVLVDVGPKTRTGYDAGARIVLPKLRRMGIGRVALILITHPDADHVGGLKAVHDRFPEAKIVASGVFRRHPEMNRWLQAASIKPEDVIWIQGRTLIRLERSALELATPVLPADGKDNDGSLFLRIQSGSGAAVLTGDASGPTELVMQGALNWRAQILKVGHHGSRTSTSQDFLGSVKPTWAVISCGRENGFGHPHKSVLDALESQRVKALRTDLQGDISFQAGPAEFTPD